MKNIISSLIIVLIIILCMQFGCKKDETTAPSGTALQAPTLSSPLNGATNQSTSPTLSWNASNGATSYTLQVSTDSLFSSYVYNQSGLMSTSQQVAGLSNSTLYYWRVNAANSYGTSLWSKTWSFTAKPWVCGDSLTYANKTYHTIAIGTQCWLRENIDVGTMITSDSTQKNNGIVEKYCYNNMTAYCDTFGGLYQWNEAMQYTTTAGTQGICPSGWHIPTSAEFQTLFSTVGNDGNALKAIGQGSGSGAGTNTSGFSALLSGYRNDDGSFYSLAYSTYYWSSTLYDITSAYGVSLYFSDNSTMLHYFNKVYGYSVRCVKD
jgi:uncharacterized protein (TIGR02145 family)